MADFSEYRQIYRYIVDELAYSPLGRADLILRVLSSFELSDEEMSEHDTNAKKNVLRSKIGAIISEMHRKGILIKSNGDIYALKNEKPISLRIESCEESLLSLFENGEALTRLEIKAKMVEIFKTDTTATQKDDNQLFTYVGRILKFLVRENILAFNNGKYYAIPEAHARIKNRQEVLLLADEFLRRIHSKGGEFFERFFMNLLTKYLQKQGKKVIESYVTGGSRDGGIDGVCVSVDSLGFRDHIMVQTKNRTVAASETEVRGFYGAVCAQRGTKGIFVTSSEFHPAATEFLEKLDDCVGIDGKKIFNMASECGYGIIHNGSELIIDAEVFK